MTNFIERLINAVLRRAAKRTTKHLYDEGSKSKNNKDSHRKDDLLDLAECVVVGITVAYAMFEIGSGHFNLITLTDVISFLIWWLRQQK